MLSQDDLRFGWVLQELHGLSQAVAPQALPQLLPGIDGMVPFLIIFFASLSPVNVRAREISSS
jgi:hypothetical protein